MKLQTSACLLALITANSWAAIETDSVSNPDSMFVMGQKYFRGEGVAKNEEEAAKWFLKSAENGHPTGQRAAGLCYVNGWGVQRDISKAAEWYEKSARQGDPIAQNNLGRMYELGALGDPNLSVAYDWYCKAAAQDFSVAQDNLGRLLYEGRGVTQNKQKAIEWFKKAAESGEPWSQYQLGMFLLTGDSMTKDETQAAIWFRKSADQGKACAQYEIGHCFENGLGVPANPREAVIWYEKAAKGNDADALFALGECLTCGKGIEKDSVKALQFFELAASQAHERALIRCGECYLDGQGTNPDLKKAYTFFLRGNLLPSLNESCKKHIATLEPKIPEAERVEAQKSAVDWLIGTGRFTVIPLPEDSPLLPQNVGSQSAGVTPNVRPKNNDTTLRRTVAPTQTTRSYFSSSTQDPPITSRLLNSDPVQQGGFKGEKYPATRCRLLNSSDIATLADGQVRYAINEMFARHGAIFGKEEINGVFKRFEWYHPRVGVDFDSIERTEFTDVERSNLRILGAARK